MQFAQGLESLTPLFLKPRLEALDTPGGVNDFGSSRIEGMAFRANFNFQFFFGRAGLHGVAAGADNFCVGKVSWVNVFFHSLDTLA